MNIKEELGVVYHFPTPGNPVCMVQMRAGAGQVIGSHRHAHEHYSILAKGSVMVHIDGAPDKVYTAGDVMIVPSHVEHRITALSDIMWFCIHGTDETDESKIDRVLIEGG